MERREFKRLPAEAEVTIRSVSQVDAPKKLGTGRNISGGGILLTSEHRLEPGTLLDIEVMTAAHRSFTHVFKPLEARVRVVRVVGDKPPYDVAAEFVEVAG